MRNMAQSYHASIIQLKYIISHILFEFLFPSLFILMLESIRKYCDINYPNIISIELFKFIKSFYQMR